MLFAVVPPLRGVSREDDERAVPRGQNEGVAQPAVTPLGVTAGWLWFSGIHCNPSALTARCGPK
ncbi:hypothetical protein GCM10010394_48330 [Streptomyces crystallinus]|uniref:Uncharacterized protein n=1 Tax=Streptomyces crystallinus TaxID=68191 RepID=A0ABP3RLJ9_9ACTN